MPGHERAALLRRFADLYRERATDLWVNTYRFIRWSTPYGGFKGSGWGRENGLEALDAYLETRTTVTSTTGRVADAT